jgi:hypothetical protein
MSDISETIQQPLEEAGRSSTISYSYHFELKSFMLLNAVGGDANSSTKLCLCQHLTNARLLPFQFHQLFV